MTSAILLAAFLSLNGEWKLDYWPQPERGAVRTLEIPVHETVAATVPGNCELDLERAGVLPDLTVGRNVLKLRPYEAYQWLYTKTFRAKAVSGEDGSKAFPRTPRRKSAPCAGRDRASWTLPTSREAKSIRTGSSTESRRLSINRSARGSRTSGWESDAMAGVASLYHALRCRKRIRWVQNCEHSWSSPAKDRQETVFN